MNEFCKEKFWKYSKNCRLKNLQEKTFLRLKKKKKIYLDASKAQSMTSK